MKELEQKRHRVKPYVPLIPFSGMLKQQQLNHQFAKFFEVFNKLHINISFMDALEQMSSYVKFMKEILTKKKERYLNMIL